MAVCRFHQEHGIGYWLPAVGVPFHHGQIWPLVILQTDGAVLTGEEFHMVLRGVQDVIRHRGHLLQGVDARLQALPADLSGGRSGAVQIPGAVLDFSQAVSDAAQGRPIAALLIQIKRRELAVGENKLSLLVSI